MSHTVVYVHYLWSTKHRRPILSPPIKQVLINHIKQNAYRQNIHIESINGHCDHLHCLVRLRVRQTIDGVVKLMKGESARWFNLKYPHMHLEWQSDYFAASVSMSVIESLKKYIANQEVHHANKSFEEEFEKLAGFRLDEQAP